MSKSRIIHHTPQYADAIGNFGPAYHLEMIKDTERVGRICAALDETLTADSIHCELGAGTGIFAIYAARRCRKVYAIEQDQEVFRIARENIERSGLQHKIELLPINAMEFRPKEKADSLLVEMMSIWAITEPQLPMMKYALKHVLKPGGQCMPRRIINLVELGNYDFGQLDASCPAAIPQFTGITPPRIMTTSQVFNEFDLQRADPGIVDHCVIITSLLSGRINCARLSSLVQFSEHITFYTTNSLMPQTIVPLKEVSVKAGDQLRFSAAFTPRSSLEASVFEIERVKG